MTDLLKEFNDPVYLIELVYSSGARVRYWFKEFGVEDGQATWTMLSTRVMALHLNLNVVESIHQIDMRELSELQDPTDTRLVWER